MATYRKTKEIHYDVRFGKVCVTPCPNISDYDGVRPFVGSVRCKACTAHVKIDREKQIVTCGFSIYRKPGYAVKKTKLISGLKDILK